MKTALVCIAASFEDNYIDEWTSYHLLLGYTDIFIYQNNCDFSSHNFDSRVHLISCNGEAQQLNAYNHFLMTFSQDYDWCTILDADEFVVLKRDDNIQSFFSRYSDKIGVGINWVLFGSSHQKSVFGEYSVIKRFTESQIGTNMHIKTSLNLACMRERGMTQSIHFVTPHSINRGDVISDLSKTSFIEGPWNREGNREVAYIAHFATKSFDECMNRRSQVRADNTTPRPEGALAFFYEHDRNEQYNYDLLNFINNRISREENTK